jgi:hypothetical protein
MFILERIDSLVQRGNWASMWNSACPYCLVLPRLLAMLTLTTLCACSGPTRFLPDRPSSVAAPLKVKGTVWQLDNQTVRPRGTWDKLGAHELLVQWISVDGISYMPGSDAAMAAELPDWERIAAEPWAENVILGLAGRFDETAARANAASLIEESRKLAGLPSPLNVVGWYFPVEVDPTWSEAPHLAPLLEKLPRPLWISVYDSANVGANTLSQWLASWLPEDVGIFFQDGVGVHARQADVARHYADVLTAQFGRKRVRMIAEAFRPGLGGGFRAATVSELETQLVAYEGIPVYLFDGPHYVSDSLVEQLIKQRR